MTTVARRATTGRLSATLKACLLSLALAGGVASAAALTDAEVRKVDRAQARLTLTHTGIAHLELPPMTMIFRVRDARLLDAVQPGDKVRVDIRKIDGQFTVTAIEARR